MDESQTDIFDKENTIAKNSGDIERLLIMQRREETILDIKRWLDSTTGSTTRSHTLRKAKNDIKMLLTRIGHLMKTSDQTKYQEIHQQLQQDNLEQAITTINQYLTEIGLTSFKKKKVDTTNIENENKEKNL